MPTKEVTAEPAIKTRPIKKSKKSRINQRALLIILAGVFLVGLLYYFRGQFIVATVNGQPIWRLTLVRELEKQGGRQTLDSIITKTLILQEAKKQKILVSNEEINQEIKKFEEDLSGQGQDLDQLLTNRGMTRADLSEQIKLQKLVEKMTKNDLQVSDQEVNEYLEKNKNTLPQNADKEQIKTQVREQLKEQKLNEKIQSFIQSLRDQAKITHLLPL